MSREHAGRDRRSTVLKGRIKALSYLAISIMCATPVFKEAAATEFTNFIGMEFASIPSGSYWMGSCKKNFSGNAGADARVKFLGQSADKPQTVECGPGTKENPRASDDEAPQHMVKVNGFQLGVREVTLGEFKEFLKKNPSYLTEDFMKNNKKDNPRNPVIASWNDAKAFVNWLNKSKPSSDKGHYRLPTEAEWEYAARAGTTTEYWWGDDFRSNYASCDCGNLRIFDVEQTGLYPPNPFGLHDVLGNVSEWVEDCWHGNYTGAPANGKAWTEAKCSDHVVRGGSVHSGKPFLRVAARQYADSRAVFFQTAFNNHIIGFRLARSQ